MTFKGGYALIDCTGFDFADTSDKMPKLYADLDKAYKANKLVLCCNMVNSATSANFSPIPAFVAEVVDGSTVTIVLTVMNIAYNIAKDGTISS